MTRARKRPARIARAICLAGLAAGLATPSAASAVSQQAYLKASNTAALDTFGRAVAISGDTMVIGAQFEDSNATGVDGPQGDDSAADSGAAYVFERTGTTWSQEAYLKASNTDAGDGFGSSVAISGDTIVIGAPGEDGNATGQSNNDASASGAAYVFERSGSAWSQQGYLKPSNTGDGDQFGSSVAISGDTIVAGALGEDSDASSQANESATNSGAAYVFKRDITTWSQQAYLKASNTDAGDGFGGAVAISGDTVSVTARDEDGDGSDENDDSVPGSGAAYVFERSGTAWSQQAYLKASNADDSDAFGSSVAISGDTIAVGAPQEDSDAISSDGNQGDDSAPNSGAAYVYERSGAAWSQQAYLKASNTDAEDRFGFAVALSGDTMVLTARDEDGDGSDANDDSAPNSGAAYVYERTGTAWSHQVYLKASNADAGDGFGSSSAVSGDTIVVGAPVEDGDSTGQANNDASASGAAYAFVNDPPSAVDDAAIVAEDSPPVAIDVLANDIDPDAGPIEIASSTDGGHGAVAITGGGTGLTYTPEPDYCNDPGPEPADSFTYTLEGGSTAIVSVTVNCADDPPIAVDDVATVAEDAKATAIDVLANDIDPDPAPTGPKRIESATNGAHGTVAFTDSGSRLAYKPDPGYCNDQGSGTPDTFTYTLNGGSAATVSVTVTCEEDPTPNAFTLGKVKRNKRQGTATIAVHVPGPGSLRLAGSARVKRRTARSEGAGTVKLKLVPTRRTRAKLARKGVARVKARITFTPDGGEPSTQAANVKLRQRR